MNLLYLGQYEQRFKYITKFIDKKNVNTIVELAFGDDRIAIWAKSKNIDWVGFDINESFVMSARKKGYQAFLQDLHLAINFPNSDITIMAGSLYHFHITLRELIDRVMSTTKTFIISEPVVNLSSKQNILGRIARRSASVSYGIEEFRYTEETLINQLSEICSNKYKINILDRHSKDLILQISHI